MIIPLYMTPTITSSSCPNSYPEGCGCQPAGTSCWQEVDNYAKQFPNVPVIVIANLYNGAQNKCYTRGCVVQNPDPTYQTWIAKLQADGVKVCGYDATHYDNQQTPTKIPTSWIYDNITIWSNSYHVNCIFFDEMANIDSPQAVADYNSYTAAASQAGIHLTIGNPGADSLAEYLGTVNMLMIYENTGLPTVGFLSGGWHGGVDKSNFGFFSYAVPTFQASYVTDRAPYVSYLYITDLSTNMYQGLPSYLGSEFSALAND